MKRNLVALALFGALCILPQALSDASASSGTAAQAECAGSCPVCPTACPNPCPSTCSVTDAGSR